uniref:Zn(2)-C6 fungal-type domain-containing protein n=2 Tax=Bionectria ochroleuca TaxID=29856 RepID=A0A0B7K947_BIOOC
MPRAKVDPRFRRRVAHACESCKKRKAKCDGILPCDQCKTRCVEDSCRYSRDPRPTSRDGSEKTIDSGGRTRGQVRVDLGEPRGSPSSIRPRHKQLDVPVSGSTASSAESQMLKDSKGKFSSLADAYDKVYAGESASLSFMETVKHAVQIAVGPCAFTNDPGRSPMVENSPKIRFDTAKRPSLDVCTAQSLASQFFLAVSGAMDLFDPPWLKDQVQAHIEQPSETPKSTCAIIYLALGIGAQGRAQGEVDDELAEECFAYGRQLTMFHLLDDPGLPTIQAILQMTYFMIASCQYNAAFINLGIAVRAAYTLGIHLHETNTAFGGDEGLSRERAWKSLRVCDLFLAASLGRPPATSESVSNIAMTPIKSLPDYESPGVAGQVFSAMFRICNVFERILVEVYAEKAVSLELAKSISRQHRQWTEELPQMLMVDGLEYADSKSSGLSPRSFGLELKHGSSLVTMAYYYSIVLLTRPFLTFQVYHTSSKEAHDDSSSARASIATYADACVNSAIKGIDIAHEYVFELNTPKRQPHVINSVFISVLCLGLACLDSSIRHRWPTDDAMDRAIKILAHLGKHSAQASRYATICGQLKEAALIYTTRRADTLLEENNQKTRTIFGDIRAPSKNHDVGEDTINSITSPQRSSWSLPTDEGIGQPMTPHSFDFSTMQDEFMLPTSGVLPAQLLSHGYEHFETDVGAAHHSLIDNVDSSGYFLEHGVPLFPVTSYVSPESYFAQGSLGETSLESAGM